MLLVNHPLPPCREQQQVILDQCPREELRFYQLAFSMGNIYYRYYNEAKNFKPTQKDYFCWLLTLSTIDREIMQTHGFDYCRRLPLFKGYVMYSKGIELDEYVLYYIEQEELAEYKKLLYERSRAKKSFFVKNPSRLFHYRYFD